MFILSHKMINLQVLGIRTGFPGDSDGKGSACSVGDLGLIPGLKDPLEERMATHSSILAWRNPRGHRSLAGYSSQCHKESDMT